MSDLARPSSLFPLPSTDTIAAIATAPGRSGIAVVRVSGSRANEIASRLLRPWPTQLRVATLCEVRAPGGERLDRAVVTRYARPRSFTGEDVIEIACHGGWGVPPSGGAALLQEGGRGGP